jgi:hypothetical protein
VPQERFVDFQETLNRTINKTVSGDRLRILQTDPRNREVAAVTCLIPGTETPDAVRLRNNYYLSIRMDVAMSSSFPRGDYQASHCRA